MRFFSLVSAFLLCGFFSLTTPTNAQTGNAFQPYNTQGDNLIHVTTADFDGVGAKDYVVAMTVKGKVIAFQRPDQISSPSTDNRLWEYTNLPSMGIRIFAANVFDSSIGDEVILPGTDGHLRVLSSTGQLLLDKDVSTGVLYSATVGKGNNGQTIIATSGVDGLVHFLDTAGVVLASHRPKTNSSANVSGLVRHVVAGDYDGDGIDEVVSFVNRKNFRGSCFFDITDLATFDRPSYWNGNTSANEDDVALGLGYTDKQLPYAYDMDGDGDDELVDYWGILHLEDGPRTQLLSTMVTDDEKAALSDYQAFAQNFLIQNHGFVLEDNETLTNTTKYLLQNGVPGDFDNDGQAELFTLYGDDLFLSDYTSSSKSLSISEYTWAHTEYHFTSVARLEDRNGGADKVILSGPANGDDHFYVVDLSNSNWRTDARNIDGTGVLGEVNQNLDQFLSDIDGFSGTVAADNDPIYYVGSFNSGLGWEMTADSIDIYVQGVYESQQEWYTEIGGQSRVRLVANVNSSIYGMSNQGKDPNITEEGVVNLCRALAERGIYFNLILGHGNNIYMSPENLVDCFEASIVDGECYMMARTKELVDITYFDMYKPHLDALLASAATLDREPPMVMLCAKGAIFSALTQQQGDTFFPAYKDIIVPGVENSNVNVQDWSIAERVGLWMNGDVKNWGCNVIGDNLSANRVAEWGGMRNAHVVLRHMLSQYALGARVFRITSVLNMSNPMYSRGDVTSDDEKWSQPYRKGVFAFLKMVEKGMYPHSPKPEEVKGISPVSVALYDRTDRITDQSYKHDHQLYYPATQDYVFNQFASWDSYTDVPDTDVTSYISGATRRWDNLLPSSQGGFVTIVPHKQASDVLKNAWCTQAYQTNGDTWDDYSLTQARTEITNQILLQRNNLDFYVDGDCFWQVTQQKDDPSTYFVVLMGNSLLSPVERTVTLKAGNSIAGACEVIDQLSNTSLGTLSTTADGIVVTIPRGAPRILSINLSVLPNQNIVQNGDFEAELINWESFNTVTATNDAYYGNFAAELSGNASVKQWRKVKPNTTYTLSAFAKVLDPENERASLFVKDQDDNNLGNVDVLETEYTPYRLKFTTAANTDSIKISFWRPSGGVDKSYIDEVILKETAYALNADFEKGLHGWDYYGGTTVETTNPFTGTTSARIDEKGGLTQWIKTKPSTTYRISFTSMVEDITKPANFYVKDSAGTKYFQQEIYDTEETQYSITFTTNANEEDSKVGFWRAKNAIGAAWVDNISITEVSAGARVGVGVEEELPLETYFKVFPNPAKDFVNIQTNNAEGVNSFVLYNIVGQPVLADTFQMNHKLSVSTLKKGTYILVVTDQLGNRNTSKLFVD